MVQSEGQELSFVSLVPQTGQTEVVIDATDLRVGEQYELVLISYDQNSTVGSTLKTDTIQIMVLEQLALVQNQVSQWTLPFGYSSSEVASMAYSIEPSSWQDFVNIDQDSQTATFIGEVPSVSDAGSNSVKVYIELTVHNSVQVKFEQTLTI